MSKSLTCCNGGKFWDSNAGIGGMTRWWAGWLERDGARVTGARMGMDGPKDLTVSGLSAVWADAQVGDLVKSRTCCNEGRKDGNGWSQGFDREWAGGGLGRGASRRLVKKPDLL
jgi:hypothetical protein